MIPRVVSSLSRPRRERGTTVRALRGILLIIFAAACGTDFEPSAPSEGAGPDVLERITRPVEGATVHLVRMTQGGDSYAFEPAVVLGAPGDVVRFVLAGSHPESVVFDAATASPEAAAFIRNHSLQLGVLLTDPGQAYDVAFTDAPPGRYPFLSQPHVARGMRGEVVIAAE